MGRKRDTGTFWAALFVEILSFFVMGTFQVSNGPGSVENAGLFAQVPLSLELVAIWLLLLGGIIRMTLEIPPQDRPILALVGSMIAPLLLWLATAVVRGRSL